MTRSELTKLSKSQLVRRATDLGLEPDANATKPRLIDAIIAKQYSDQMIDDLNRQVAELAAHTPVVHRYDSTRQAYAASQTDDNVRDGDVLLAVRPGRPAVAAVLTSAWPVVVDADEETAGQFHIPTPTINWADLNDTGADYTRSVQLARDAVAAETTPAAQDDTPAEATPAAKPARTPKTPKASAGHRCECSRWRIVPGDDTPAMDTDTGCDATTQRRFAPGHDAKLKGLLVRAAAASLRVQHDGEEPVDPMAAASTYGFSHQVGKAVQSRRADATRRETLAARQATRRVTGRVNSPSDPPKVCIDCGKLPALPGNDRCRADALTHAMAALQTAHANR